ncbi:MAG TPA: tryptophan--tRNA ligase, partial [Bauldia sp.]|nr:tryptophan--tRNA ligase [Bauldia sp.]
AGEMRKLLADPGHIDAILADGAGRAAAIAEKTMAGVKDVVGFIRRK